MYRTIHQTIHRTISCLAVATLLAACATDTGPDERELETALWLDHAGPAENGFVFGRPEGWKQLDGDWIALRTLGDRHYLVQLDPACADDLRFGAGLRLGIVQQTPNLLSRSDTVLTGDMRCRIREIRPVDSDALAADLESAGIEQSFVRNR